MLRSTFSNLREYLTPVTHTSSFQKTGEITPEEFVQAGDYLVDKFPTWQWSAASPGKTRSFLPENKQFLVTNHVPCRSRASGPSGAASHPVELDSDEGDALLVGAPIGSIDHGSGSGETPVVDVADLSDELEGLGIEEDGSEFTGTVPHDTGRSANEDRTYNVYITYSTSYRVPKAYLSGFDADGLPLPPSAMFDDVVGDYRDKTVTIESAPFQKDLTLISIHPCRHAGVMRMLLDRSEASIASDSVDDEWEEVPTGLRVDQYLVVFLKFIASVTPTIEHDFTMSAL